MINLKGIVVHCPRYKSDNKFHSLLFYDNIFIQEICITDTFVEAFEKSKKFIDELDDDSLRKAIKPYMNVFFN